MKRLVAVFAAVFSISLAGSLTAMTLEPQPALPQSEPVILGEVSEVGNHSVTVTAPGDEQMTFEFDSRTMLPASLENGERVKVEYRILDSGLHLAQRVTPLSVGSRDWATLERQMSMVPPPEEGSNMLVASTATDENAVHNEQEMTSSNEEQQETPAQERAEEQNENQNQNANAQTNESEHHNMPRTASPLPWLLVGSGLMMFLFGGLWLLRHTGRTA